MTLPRQDIGWTPDTLYAWTRDRLHDAEKFQAALVAAQEKRLDKLESEMSQRFDGVDENFRGLRADFETSFTSLNASVNAIGKTISERGGGLNLLRSLVPNVISIASIVALILVAKH